MLPALVFCSLIIAFSSALDVNLTVGDSDPHVSYSGQVIADANSATKCVNSPRQCRGQWWTENIDGAFRGAVRVTAGSQLQVVFQGSSIAVIGVRDKDGGRAVVAIDGGPQSSLDFGAKDGQRHTQQTVFSSGTLNASTPHTLNLWYDARAAPHGQRPVIRVDAFVITFPDTQQGPFPNDLPVPAPPGGSPPGPSASSYTEPSFTQPVTNSDPGPTDGATESTAGPSQPAVVGTTRSSRSSAIPIVAGLVTGLGTLLVAGGILFWFFRRRRAVPVQSMTPVRTSMPAHAAARSPAGAGAPARGGLLSRATYAFTRRGSSVASSSDPPITQTAAPPPSVPRLTAFVNPYTYRHTYDYPRSGDSTSLGPPVDERPPNVPQPPLASPISPARTSPPRRLQVFNPDANTVVSSESSGSGAGRR